MVPPSDVCWFINPICRNTIVISAINHRFNGSYVNPNLAIPNNRAPPNVAQQRPFFFSMAVTIALGMSAFVLTDDSGNEAVNVGGFVAELVGADWNMTGLWLSHINWEWKIIPTDELIFFRGVETINQLTIVHMTMWIMTGRLVKCLGMSRIMMVFMMIILNIIIMVFIITAWWWLEHDWTMTFPSYWEWKIIPTDLTHISEGLAATTSEK